MVGGLANRARYPPSLASERLQLLRASYSRVASSRWLLKEEKKKQEMERRLTPSRLQSPPLAFCGGWSSPLRRCHSHAIFSAAFCSGKFYQHIGSPPPSPYHGPISYPLLTPGCPSFPPPSAPAPTWLRRPTAPPTPGSPPAAAEGDELVILLRLEAELNDEIRRVAAEIAFYVELKRLLYPPRVQPTIF